MSKVIQEGQEKQPIQPTDSTSAGQDEDTVGLLIFYSRSGIRYCIRRKFLDGLQSVDQLFPCPWTDDWVEGLMVWQQAALPLIDVDRYVETFDPELFKRLNAEIKTSQFSQDKGSGKKSRKKSGNQAAPKDDAGAKTTGDAQSGTHDWAECAVILRKEGMIYGVRAFGARLMTSHAPIKQEEVLEGGLIHETYALSDGETVTRVELGDLMSRMAWLDEHLLTKEEATESEDGNHHDGDSSLSATQHLSDALELQERVESERLLLITIDKRTTLIPSSNIIHLVRRSQQTAAPSYFPSWIVGLHPYGEKSVAPIINLVDITLPIPSLGDALEDEHRDIKARKRSGNRTLIFLDSDDQVLAIEADECRLLSLTTKHAESERYRSIDGKTIPILSVDEVAAVVKPHMSLPLRIYREAMHELQSYILVHIGDIPCAVNVSQTLQIVDSSAISSYQYEQDQQASTLESLGEVIGIVNSYANIVVPVIDIEKNLIPNRAPLEALAHLQAEEGVADQELPHGTEERIETEKIGIKAPSSPDGEIEEETESILILGHEPTKAFGILVSSVKGLLRVNDRQILSLRGNTPLIKGLLQIGDDHQTFILGMGQ